MNDTRLSKLLETRGPHLMAHLIAGYPSVAVSREVARTLIAGGADILEVQIPFSDPLADGPTIVAACHEALKNGCTVADAFTLVSLVRSESETPIVLMTYANIVVRRGIEAFVLDAVRAGADALIVPDVPPDSEEGKELIRACDDYGLHAVLVVSPGVSQKRLRALKPSVRGFVYATSRRGTTGTEQGFAAGLARTFAEIKTTFNSPLGLGFGIKDAADYQAAAKLADVVIVGSAFVEIVRKNPKSFRKPLLAFIRQLQGR